MDLVVAAVVEPGKVGAGARRSASSANMTMVALSQEGREGNKASAVGTRVHRSPHNGVVAGGGAKGGVEVEGHKDGEGARDEACHEVDDGVELS